VPALLLAAAALAGCSAIAALDRAATPVDAHELRVPGDVPRARSARNAQLVVETPVAGGAIDTDRILVRPGATRVAYLPDARWSAAAPEMLQTAMVGTFLESGGFRFVGRRPLGARGDVALVSELTAFGAHVAPGREAGQGTAEVRVALVATLVREGDGDILATRRFARTAAIPDTSTAAILAGFDAASAALLRDLAAWVLETRGIATVAPAAGG
jgi:cholesterol transport system auxiliary component